MGISTTTILQKVLCAAFLLFVSLQHLSAECQYKQIINGESLSVGVMLNWSTNLEKENAMFIVERSEDGVKFTNIGAVKGAGFSSSYKDYSFLDSNSAKGQCYYRLRQIDYNGAYSTSAIYVFNIHQPEFFSISNITTISSAPNKLEIQFDSFKTGEFEYELMDWQGKRLLVDQMEAKKGKNTLQVDLSDSNDLIFQLILKTENQEQTITFRKKQDSSSLATTKN